MIEFNVPDMTCGGCASRIRRALAEVAPDATLDIDVARRRVRVASPATGVDTQALRVAVARAGYTAQPVPAGTSRPQAGGCCCAARRAAPRIDTRQTQTRPQGGCCG